MTKNLKFCWVTLLANPLSDLNMQTSVFVTAGISYFFEKKILDLFCKIKFLVDFLLSSSNMQLFIFPSRNYISSGTFALRLTWILLTLWKKWWNSRWYVDRHFVDRFFGNVSTRKFVDNLSHRQCFSSVCSVAAYWLPACPNSLDKVDSIPHVTCFALRWRKA